MSVELSGARLLGLVLAVVGVPSLLWGLSHQNSVGTSDVDVEEEPATE